jgi:hypothetical protein
MNILTTARVGAYGIAAIAAAMSYGHQVTLLDRADLGLYSYAVPITVDVLAFIAAMVRNSDVADDTARRAAMWTLLFAGTASVAANIAVGTNPVQRIVGFWTVAAYLLAEWFVSRLKSPLPPRSSPRLTTRPAPGAARPPAGAPRPATATPRQSAPLRRPPASRAARACYERVIREPESNSR